MNSVYLDIGVQGQIQAQFEDDSQIELPDFLLVREPFACSVYIQYIVHIHMAHCWWLFT